MCVLAEALFFFKFENVGNFAIQGVAKGIKRFCADRLSLFDSMKGVGGKTLLEDQVIFSYTFFVESFIKGSITNQYHHRIYSIILNLLTILKKLSIMAKRNVTRGKVARFLRRTL